MERMPTRVSVVGADSEPYRLALVVWEAGGDMQVGAAS